MVRLAVPAGQQHLGGLPGIGRADERREVGPRWRICNRNTTSGILEANREFDGDRSTIALRP
jgi:hypothetical protein